ncbi:MDR family MFS transporter [Shouchella clausii]|uniref:MDR family MFS transporter n=1 Tax=Shouchella clausii TaxID=79880 RepID=UPI000BA5DC39|nr:MFS transporter [Shouchella clausii]MBX0318022.1 MFS transporter [Shouchella clausii]PAE92187.1 MFS transporter [Shouchella clausii]
MPKSIWILMVATAINITGASFLWPLNAIIMTQLLGQSLTASGAVLMLNAGAGVLGSLIGGRLYDRIGAYPTILLGCVLSAASAVLLAFYYGEYGWYAVFLAGMGFGSGMMAPSMYALAGSLWPEGGRKSANAIYVAQNVGVSLGTALIGVVTLVRLTDVFVANAAMHVLLLVYIAVFFRHWSGSKGRTAGAGIQHANKASKYRSQALWIVSVAFFISWLGYTQWQANVSVYIQSLDIPLHAYSILWTMNGLLIVLAQPLIQWVIQKGRLTLKGQMGLGLFIFALSYLVLTQAQVFSGFFVAMLILTIGEMFVWPAVPTIANALAPSGREGAYQGIVNSVATGGRMIGPLLGGIVVDRFSIQVLFVLISILLLLAIPLVRLYDRPLLKEHQNDHLNNAQ